MLWLIVLRYWEKKPKIWLLILFITDKQQSLLFVETVDIIAAENTVCVVRLHPERAMRDLRVSLLLDSSSDNISCYLQRGLLYGDLSRQVSSTAVLTYLHYNTAATTLSSIDTTVSKITWISRYQNVKLFWVLLQWEMMDVAVVMTGTETCANHMHLAAVKSPLLVCEHLSFFTGWDAFPATSQQCQSTEANL